MHAATRRCLSLSLHLSQLPAAHNFLFHFFFFISSSFPPKILSFVLKTKIVFVLLWSNDSMCFVVIQKEQLINQIKQLEKLILFKKLLFGFKHWPIYWLQILWFSLKPWCVETLQSPCASVVLWPSAVSSLSTFIPSRRQINCLQLCLCAKP